MLTLLRDGLLDLIYPPFCILCENHIIPRFPKDVVCLDCEEKLQNNIPPFCTKCSRFLGAASNHAQCRSCRRINPHFDFAWAACLYTDGIQKLIHEFKYNQKTLLTHYLGQRIIRFIHSYNFDIYQFELIVPIPLSSTRHRERGYNQSQLLAQTLSRHYQIPLCVHNLTKAKHTRPQTQLSQKERWTNLHGAFRIKNLNTFKNKNVLIVDDLLTTGATASEAAKVLKQNGAKTVGILTLAVTPEIELD